MWIKESKAAEIRRFLLPRLVYGLPGTKTPGAPTLPRSVGGD